jgi:hypothetical protein
MMDRSRTSARFEIYGTVLARTQQKLPSRQMFLLKPLSPTHGELDACMELLQTRILTKLFRSGASLLPLHLAENRHFRPIGWRPTHSPIVALYCEWRYWNESIMHW